MPTKSHPSGQVSRLRAYATTVRAQVLEAAQSGLPVLLEGETGTGKTYLARLIHLLGPRAGHPFVPVNCGALPSTLLQEELFGHERGAYTGAMVSRAGVFERAGDGAVFLDEIGDLQGPAQASLLKVIEEGWVRRLGGSRELRVTMRIICATNQDLRRLIKAGEFREDLYFRCSGIRITLEPLREQPDRLRLLVPILLEEIARGAGPPGETNPDPPPYHDDIVSILAAHSWPGNMRELRMVLTRAYDRAVGARIEAEHLPGLEETHWTRDLTKGRAVRSTRYRSPQDPAAERDMILRALTEHASNRTRAAKALGMSRTTLWERMRLYGIGEASEE